MKCTNLNLLKTSLIIGFGLALQLCVFVPALIYATNQSEFSLGLFNILPHLLGPVFLGLVIFSLIGILIPERLARIFLSLGLGLNLAMYVQSNLLLWNYGIFDGKEILWRDFFVEGIIDMVCWVAILGGTLLFSKSALGFSTKILATIALLHLLNLVYVIREAKLNWYSAAPKLENQTLYQFSPEKNVVMIVLDGFLSPAFDKLIELDPDVRESFSDFVYFKNTLASFPTTSPSIPAMLSGEEYDNSTTLSSFLADAIGERSIPSVLFKQGFSVDLVTLDHYCRHLKSNSCSSLAANRQKSAKQHERSQLAVLFDMTLFRSLPGFLKRSVYNNQEWLFQSFFQSRKGPAIHVHSLDFMDSFVPNLNTHSSKPTFKFIHLIIPHIPLRLGPDCEYRKDSKHTNREEFLMQASCALKLAETLIGRLKELQVYDQSMIVVLADHGMQFNFGHYTRKPGIPPLGVALPLLLVKPFNHHAELQIADLPAKLADVPETIRAALSLPGSFPGQSVFEISATLPRKRIFRNYQWQHSLWKSDSLPKMKEFVVDGDAWNPDSWEFVRDIAPFNPDAKIN